MAAISALAYQKPDMIYDMFITKEVNNSGIYAIQFYINGARKVVHVDDYLPTQPNFYGSNLIMGSSKDPGELWIPLIEKAWAKLHGSYCQIEGGNPTSVFTHMSNTPSIYLPHKQHEMAEEVTKMQIWQKISHAFKMDCVMTSCAGTHAYGLLACRSIADENIVHIRNPWGNRAFPQQLQQAS